MGPISISVECPYCGRVYEQMLPPAMPISPPQISSGTALGLCPRCDHAVTVELHASDLSEEISKMIRARGRAGSGKKWRIQVMDRGTIPVFVQDDPNYSVRLNADGFEVDIIVRGDEVLVLGMSGSFAVLPRSANEVVIARP